MSRALWALLTLALALALPAVVAALVLGQVLRALCEAWETAADHWQETRPAPKVGSFAERMRLAFELDGAGEHMSHRRSVTPVARSPTA